MPTLTPRGAEPRLGGMIDNQGRGVTPMLVGDVLSVEDRMPRWWQRTLRWLTRGRYLPVIRMQVVGVDHGGTTITVRNCR